jgi:hypothetical protein
MDVEEKRLDRLSELLHALPVDNFPMTISKLDGYVTGILACPEMIPPSEWLPEVWGETGEAQFADQKMAEETIGAVMTHYNSVGEAMTRSPWIEPIYEVDPNSDETLWEPWMLEFTLGTACKRLGGKQAHAFKAYLQRALVRKEAGTRDICHRRGRAGALRSVQPAPRAGGSGNEASSGSGRQGTTGVEVAPAVAHERARQLEERPAGAREALAKAARAG